MTAPIVAMDRRMMKSLNMNSQFIIPLCSFQSIFYSYIYMISYFKIYDGQVMSKNFQKFPFLTILIKSTEDETLPETLTRTASGCFPLIHNYVRVERTLIDADSREV
jgi:hypothetical protein